jgi:primary-amine oxidase
MSKRWRIAAGTLLLAGLCFGLLFQERPPAAVEARLPQADQPKAKQPQPASHPLDPLTRDELGATVAILKAEGKLAEDARFATLALHEPPKEEVLAFQPGGPLHRKAFAVVLDRKANKTAEAVVDLKARKVVSWQDLPGVQAPVLIEEFTAGGDLVRVDPRWRRAMERRGIKDFDKVQLDVWAAGPHPAAGNPPARLLRVLSYYRGGGSNGYGRPIEGVAALVNMTTKKVLEVIDTGVVPTPGGDSDFFDPKTVGPVRAPLPPLLTSQPRGPGFEVSGHEVRWQNWRFRYALHPREGLVLYTVGYQDGNRLRPILYRASLAELMVPYGDPEITWSWRNAFDEGEYAGVGRGALPLRPGQMVPEHARLFDADFVDDLGKPFVQQAAVAVFEQDGGMLWTHTDYVSERSETRRSRQLVLTTLFGAGNYDYQFQWIFHQDGVLEVKAGLAGIVLARGVAATACEVCRQLPGADGKVLPTGTDRFGTVVARNIVATNHQHFLCFRLDFDVDGPRNSVHELNVVPAPPTRPTPSATPSSSNKRCCARSGRPGAT